MYLKELTICLMVRYWQPLCMVNETPL